MCANEIADFIKNLHLLVLPSTLWAVHIDPKQEYLAVIHLNVTSTKISIDKGVLLTTENCTPKTSALLNDEIVELPTLTGKIETISELTSLIYNLHDVKTCAKCSKYLSDQQTEFCDPCAFEGSLALASFPDLTPRSVYSNMEDKSDYLLEGVSFDESVIPEPSESEERKHLCTVCGKTFSCSSGLDHHMLTHSEDKPFKCEVCGKTFAKKYNLNVHTRVHSGTS